MTGRFVYLSETPPEADNTLYSDIPVSSSRKQVAELFGCDVKTISREIQRGNLKCFHVGRNVRISREHVIEYMRGAEACM